MTDTADVAVSGRDIPGGFEFISDPEGDRELAPVVVSPPFVDTAELCVPPALAEFREMADDTDIRFEFISDIDGVVISKEFDSSGCRESSAMVEVVEREVSI